MEDQTQRELLETNFIVTPDKTVKRSPPRMLENEARYPALPSLRARDVILSYAFNFIVSCRRFAQCVQRGEAGQRRPLLISGGDDLCQRL